MTDAHFHPGLTGRKRMTPQDARGRTLRVKAIRVFFVAGALASIFALVGSVAVRLVLTATNPLPPVVQGENLVIEKPRFVGRAKDGGKIIVTAQTATRSSAAQNGAVQLVKPVLETSDGSQATAATGVWSQSEQNLLLDGEVVLTRQGGDRATSARAVWTSVPSQLEMSGGVTLTRQGGDQATAASALWSTQPSQLMLTGNVALSRATGARATSGKAIWRTDIGSLDLLDGTNITLPSGESATAIAARLDDRRGDLRLNGQAVVRFSSGQATSANAYYDALTGKLTGEGGVQITSSLGTGRADRYVYETRSKRLNLNGNARATLR